jgi:hypothetical protein
MLKKDLENGKYELSINLLFYIDLINQCILKFI